MLFDLPQPLPISTSLSGFWGAEGAVKLAGFALPSLPNV
ncbi:uncharacterized protein CLUP02_02497 [Colletotrichum lupini]|uniref:Uncharacterized protein n=1 Tax=Colletotrichum lupini TaxID=145971 RepID=A0A9Q8WBF1_9PEZI|nr:uncharacterized protein CLUP02_02497 [Colletotrichum lupini]UQC77031.1 hypothetical protein CLUP02_02497 [Colletotrichum lupini]